MRPSRRRRSTTLSLSNVSRVCTRGDTGVIKETREERGGGANARNRRIDFPSRIWGRTTVLRANLEPKDSSWGGKRNEARVREYLARDGGWLIRDAYGVINNKGGMIAVACELQQLDSRRTNANSYVTKKYLKYVNDEGEIRTEGRIKRFLFKQSFPLFALSRLFLFSNSPRVLTRAFSKRKIYPLTYLAQDVRTISKRRVDSLTFM